MMWRHLPGILALMLLGACTNTHQSIRADPPGTARLTLAPADSLLVATPKDGATDTTVYRGSGQHTGQMLQAAFARRTHAVKVGPFNQDYDDALALTRQMGQKYLVYSTILQWQELLTEWPATADRIEIRIDVVDAATGNTAASSIIKARSGWPKLVGQDPQDLLPRALDDFVSSLY